MNPFLRPRLSWLLLLVFGLGSAGSRGAEPGDEPIGAKPIEALLITGGKYHDYEQQKQILTEGISARANVHWHIFYEDGDTGHKLSIYQNPDWAKGYDVVVHNECFATVGDPDFVERILAPHRHGVPAVVIHCTLHTFMVLKTDQWREFIGMSSNHHNTARPFDVFNTQPENPIMTGFPPVWSLKAAEELYVVYKIWPRARPLAWAYSVEDKKSFPVISTNLYGPNQTRVFGTSLVHWDSSMADPIYLGLVTRGLLWACNKLGPDGQPLPGYGPPDSLSAK